jgi:hypothetical protein
VNNIVSENSETSGVTNWSASQSQDVSIQGFSTDISVNKGEWIDFKISTTATNYHVDIYRMGFYGGSGARMVAGPIAPLALPPPAQPVPAQDAAAGLRDYGVWSVSASWHVPDTMVSGVYIAKLVNGDDAAKTNYIPFIVRDDASHSDLLFQTSDTTWQAYNKYGGCDLYGGDGPAVNPLTGRAFKVSYNRPFTSHLNHPTEGFFHAEYAMARWLERNGYDVTYTAGVDSHRRGDLIRNHKVFLSVGHDEYVSREQREAVEDARDSGVHLAFFSGNEVFWKIRWEESIDGSHTPDRTLVCYKETYPGADNRDPSGEWTGTWRDPRYSPPKNGGRPENALTGTLCTVPTYSYQTLEVPAAESRMRFWRNTPIANVGTGGSGNPPLPEGVLGYEWDEDVDNLFRPAGLVRLSSTTRSTYRLIDYGTDFPLGWATHSLTLYRWKPGGALVFGAGTVQWSWGLDPSHDNDGQFTGQSAADARMQQATVNLLADMGAQPGGLQTDLQPASASADTDPPTSLIEFPTDRSSVRIGKTITIKGTASDVGGVVGGVEVSTDGGVTWRPAIGRERWSYDWTPLYYGPTTIKSRAVDDSGNLETPSPPRVVTVLVVPPDRCVIWEAPLAPEPSVVSDSTNAGVEIGVKFRSDVPGYVKGVRFFKAVGETGQHKGHLWTADGARLVEATFSSETASGWQEVAFPGVLIKANTTYVASCHFEAHAGYVQLLDYFKQSGVHNPPLHALEEGVDGGNGVYEYDAPVGAGGFPSKSFRSSNYFIDVVFDPSVNA